MDAVTVSVSQPSSIATPPPQHLHQATWQDPVLQDTPVRDYREQRWLFFNQGWMIKGG